MQKNRASINQHKKVLNNQIKIILILLFLFLSFFVQAQVQNTIATHSEDSSQKNLVQITPSEVFTEILKVQTEIEILKKYFITNTPNNTIEKIPSRANEGYKPKHVWQMIYMLQVKINLFRVKQNLPRVEEVGMEPVLNVNPNMPYGMSQRLLTEIRIIKSFYGISEKIPEQEKVQGKTPSDVYNQLLQLSLELDYLNTQGITPSAVFAEVMRLYQDITSVLYILNIDDKTIPPNKSKQSAPKDAYTEVEKFIEYLKKLQRMADIQRTSFSGLKKQLITPEDTFILVGMAIAEFQTIKAFLGLVHKVTPPSIFYANKTPADVEQLVIWTTRRLNLIKDLEVVHVK